MRKYEMSTSESRTEAAIAVLVVLLIGIILGLASSLISGCSGRFSGTETNSVDSGTFSDVLGDSGPGDSATLDGRSDGERDALPEEKLEADDGADAPVLDAHVEVGADAGFDASGDVEVDAYDPTYDITTCSYECVYMYEENPTLEYPWCPRATHYLMNCCKPKNPSCTRHETIDYYYCCTD